MTIAKVDSFRDESVQIWGWNHFGRVVDGEIAPGHIVRIDQKHVWTFDVVSLVCIASDLRSLPTTGFKIPSGCLFRCRQVKVEIALIGESERL